ncbi:FliA/WhiG family RNA polymerase sigma factor [Streptomyces sp. NPDC058739]|uniref:FliA/WhiG family RNA polymerase sigma factor n=1 Tax=Streptomyces sp. NPDC058739 TaxID=3346618 RepID=UPI0036A352B7
MAPSAAEERNPQAPAPCSLDEVWRRYRATGDGQLREQLILHYSPLVKYVADRVSTGVPTTVDLTELVSAGVMALIEAIEGFDPDRPVRFETYAVTRIRRALVDELRALERIPPSTRRRARQVEHAYAALETRLRRTPSQTEVAAELGVEPGELDALMNQLTLANVRALEEILRAETTDGAGTEATKTLERLGSDIPAELLQDQQTRRLLARAINDLPEREKTVITLRYYEGLEFAEIGHVIGVTEKRIAQIHIRAVLQLRAKLETSALRTEGDSAPAGDG